jgi:hypothetical protein
MNSQHFGKRKGEEMKKISLLLVGLGALSLSTTAIAEEKAPFVELTAAGSEGTVSYWANDTTPIKAAACPVSQVVAGKKIYNYPKCSQNLLKTYVRTEFCKGKPGNTKVFYRVGAKARAGWVPTMCSYMK